MSEDATKVTPARLRRDAYLYIRQSCAARRCCSEWR